MNHSEVVQKIKQIVIVPIVRAADAESAVRAVEAIAEGGIPCAEITMTVPGAVRALEEVAKRFGDKILLGAGTVLDPEIEFAKRYSKAIFPGALTPTEIVTAWQAGADAIKVFPCSALGGAKYIKALKGPFPQIEFVPTGGVNLNTLKEFIEAGCSAVGVGSELVDAATIASGKYEVITERARQFRQKADEIRS